MVILWESGRMSIVEFMARGQERPYHAGGRHERQERSCTVGVGLYWFEMKTFLIVLREVVRRG